MAVLVLRHHGFVHTGCRKEAPTEPLGSLAWRPVFRHRAVGPQRDALHPEEVRLSESQQAAVVRTREPDSLISWPRYFM